MLVTCGNRPDPRLDKNVDIANELTFVFRSDSNNPHYRGVNLTIIEMNATAANVSDNKHLHVICDVYMYKCIIVGIQWH